MATCAPLFFGNIRRTRAPSESDAHWLKLSSSTFNSLQFLSSLDEVMAVSNARSKPGGLISLLLSDHCTDREQNNRTTNGEEKEENRRGNEEEQEMRGEKDEKRGATYKTNSIKRGRQQEEKREEQQDNKRRPQGEEKEQEEQKEEQQIRTNRTKVRGGKQKHPRWSAAWEKVRSKYPTGVAFAWHIDNPAPKSVDEDYRWEERRISLLEEDDRREEQKHPRWSAAYEKVRCKYPRGVATAWYKTNPAPKSVDEDSLWKERPICSQIRVDWKKCMLISFMHRSSL